MFQLTPNIKTKTLSLILYEFIKCQIIELKAFDIVCETGCHSYFRVYAGNLLLFQVQPN